MTAAGDGLPPGMALVGLLFAFAGYVMVNHRERLGQDNERRNVRLFGQRLGSRLDGAPWQVKQAGIGFIAVGLVISGLSLAAFLP